MILWNINEKVIPNTTKKAADTLCIIWFLTLLITIITIKVKRAMTDIATMSTG